MKPWWRKHRYTLTGKSQKIEADNMTFYAFDLEHYKLPDPNRALNASVLTMDQVKPLDTNNNKQNLLINNNTESVSTYSQVEKSYRPEGHKCFDPRCKYNCTQQTTHGVKTKEVKDPRAPVKDPRAPVKDPRAPVVAKVRPQVITVRSRPPTPKKLFLSPIMEEVSPLEEEKGDVTDGTCKDEKMKLNTDIQNGNSDEGDIQNGNDTTGICEETRLEDDTRLRDETSLRVPRMGSKELNARLSVLLTRGRLAIDRTQLLREMEAEDQHRKWYYEQLEALTKKIDSLPVSDKYDLQSDMTRRQLEYEARKLREHMQEKLGSAELIAQRHEARLQRIRLIEMEMLRLQRKHREQLDLSKRDSGTCDHLETERDGVVVVDAGINTVLSGQPQASNDVFRGHTDHEAASLDTGAVVAVGAAAACGHIRLITVGTQTPEDALAQAQALGHAQTFVGDTPQTTNQNISALYHGSWPLNSVGTGPGSLSALMNEETASVMSFNSANTSSTNSAHRITNQQLGTKVEMVYSLLSMLGTHDKDDMSRTLLAMSSSPDSCIAMKQSGCLQLLIQLLHGTDKESVLGTTRGRKAARARAAAALHNIVHSHPDDKQGRREARVLRLLEQIRAHCDQLQEHTEEEDEDRGNKNSPGDIDHHPGPAIAALMKLSFDEEHRHAICTLGGLQAIAELLQLDHQVNGNTAEQYNITMRRYACMALTNLTFGDGTNKALLCSMRVCLEALVAQLASPNEDLRQVAASVLRNLSWRADLASKKTLREVGAVSALMKASMEVRKESTLKSILSALWNMSAHCSENKADICAVCGSLAFLVSSLTYKSPSKTLAIIENGGGILRNISSHIAVREDYRQVLRDQDCLQILLKHLRSPSLTIVSNACGTLWNLSARCAQDQKALWEMGAVSMLRNLVHSKHKMISMGSAAALKNLLAAKPAMMTLDGGHHTKNNMPSLHVRKQRAMEAEIDPNLAETCENVESPTGSPIERKQPAKDSPGKFTFTDLAAYHCHNMNSDNHLEGRRPVSRSASQDSVGSVHSDTLHDRPRHNMPAARLMMERQAQSQEGHHYGDGIRSHDPRGETGPPNSRILQVMREVEAAAGQESGGYTKDPYMAYLQGTAHAPGSPRRAHQHERPIYTRIDSYSGSEPDNREPADLTFPQLSQRMENLRLGEEGQDQPINYSLKYVDAPTPAPNAPTYGQPGFCPVYPAGRPASGSPQSQQDYAGYNESEMDNMDQPTNFSERFAEHVDEAPEYTDQPINYSTRYQEPECPLDARRHLMEQEHTAEDTVKTFCTEDTPLNFLSTATSMDDLSQIKEEEGEESEDPSSVPHEKASTTGSGERSNQPQMDSMANLQNNNLPPPPPDLYDDSISSSPSEKPHQYHVEDTPVCFSRASSLSSLHSGDGSDGVPATESSPPQAAREESNQSLQRIDEEASLDVTVTKLDAGHNFNDSAHTDGSTPGSTAGKTVTFDDNVVQETPMMFSRCSSLGSLSSFDAHSIHSSVVSEYSRRASEVVSPSELPDSPSDSMPASPGHRDKSIKFDVEEAAQNLSALTLTQPTAERPDANTTSHTLKPDNPVPQVFQDQTRNFAQEEGDLEGFSCATSLSRLTFDDEPSIEKSPELKRVLVGKESSLDGSLGLDDDGSSVSEGEEDMLAQCINMAMPTQQSRKMRRSTSDSFLKKRGPPGAKAGSTPRSHVPTMKVAPLQVSRTHHGSLQQEQFLGGAEAHHEAPRPDVQGLRHQDHLLHAADMDSVQKFATEGTPLNFSNAASLSDLSMHSEEDPSPTKKGPQQDKARPGQDSLGDIKSDVSSLGEEDDEDLLSATIEAAMPKSKPKKRRSHDAAAKPSPLYNQKSTGSSQKPSQLPRSQFSPARSMIPRQGSTPVSHLPRMQSTPVSRLKSPQLHQPPEDVSSDAIKTYAVEGTPLNFSRAGSLSDLSCDNLDDLDAAEPASDVAVLAQAPAASHDSFPPPVQAHVQEADEAYYNNLCDSPCHYGTEGTPLNFSRNDSLSSLSCEEDCDLQGDLKDLKEKPLPGRKSSPGKVDHMTPRQRLLNKKGFVSPGSGGRGKPTSRAQRSLNYDKVGGSPGAGSHGPDMSSPPRHGASDDLHNYATEGTPMCFSRNSSLSSLDSDGHEALANQSGGSNGHLEEGDREASFKVEDTPANFSKNSSLSSLSIESLGFEPTPSESALLEECINAAMPKSNRAGKKKSGQASASKDKSAKGAENKSSKSEIPKNVVGIPAGAETSADSKPPGVQVLADSAAGMPETEDDTHAGGVGSTEVDALADQLQDDLQVCDEDRAFLESTELHDCDMIASAIFREASQIAEGLEAVDSDMEEASIVDKEEVEATKEGRRLSEDGQLDITAETLPEMGSSLFQSGIRLPGTPGTPGLHSNITVRNSTEVSAENSLLDHTLSDLKQHVADDSLAEMSPEEASALEENANIILSELSGCEIMESGHSDDMFIENETISLVSNDYTSDTASEVSVSMSCSSHTMSDHNSDISSATFTISTPPEPARPRIVKPGQKPAVKSEEEAKAIRGKRKSVHSFRPNMPPPKPPGAHTAPKTPNVRASIKPAGAAGKPGPGAAKATPVKPPVVKSGPGKPPVTKTTATKPSAAKPIPAKGLATKTPANKALAAKAPATKAPASKAPVTKGPAGKPPPTPKNSQQTRANLGKPPPKPSGITPPRAGPTKKISPDGTTAAQTKAAAAKKPATKIAPRVSVGGAVKTSAAVKPSKEEISRPKPPIKQGTFTKESPTEGLAEAASKEGSPVDTVSASSSNRSSAELKYCADSQEKLASASSNSPVSPPEEQGTSEASPAEEPVAVTAATRAGRALSLGKRPTGGKAKPVAVPKVPSLASKDKQGSSGSLSSQSSLNKSNTSLNRSNNSLNRSNGSLNKVSTFKVPAKPVMRKTSEPNIKKSESQSSLKKSEVPSRPGPPTNPRRSSLPMAAGSPVANKLALAKAKSATMPQGKQPAMAPNVKGTGKKTAPSKGRIVPSRIANLWKKDDSSSDDSKSDKAINAGASKKPARKSLLPSRSPTAKSKTRKQSLPAELPSSSGDGLKRSSTYDKLDSDCAEETPSQPPADTEEPPASPNKTLWRRTYTIENEEELSVADDLVIDDTPQKEATMGEGEAPALPLTNGVWIKAGDSSPPSSQAERASKPDSVHTTPTKSAIPVGKPATPPSNMSTFKPLASSPTSRNSDIRSPAANAAIVAPFNYTPSPTSNSPPTEVSLKNSVNKSPLKSTANSPTKAPQTKTEMLLARRRRSYLNSLKSEESEDEEAKKKACIITTV